MMGLVQVIIVKACIICPDTLRYYERMTWNRKIRDYKVLIGASAHSWVLVFFCSVK